MNLLRTLVAFTSLVVTCTATAETAHNFVGEITGLVCASCKQEVVAALSKLDGVKNVEIVPSNNPEIRQITINAERAQLTEADVNQALGKEFKVTKLAKADIAASK